MYINRIYIHKVHFCRGVLKNFCKNPKVTISKVLFVEGKPYPTSYVKIKIFREQTPTNNYNTT